MKNFVFVSIVLLSFAFPAQSQDAPVMQKTASGDEIHIDFYSAYKNRSPILLTSQIADDPARLQMILSLYLWKLRMSV